MIIYTHYCVCITSNITFQSSEHRKIHKRNIRNLFYCLHIIIVQRPKIFVIATKIRFLFAGGFEGHKKSYIHFKLLLNSLYSIPGL